MYFNDKFARYFGDGAELDDNTASVCYEYLNEEGTIDVHTAYDENGRLIGVEKQ